MVEPTIQLTPLERFTVTSAADRARLHRRARMLAWGGNAWHLVEFGIAIGAGIAAGSIALIGFGVCHHRLSPKVLDIRVECSLLDGALEV